MLSIVSRLFAFPIQQVITAPSNLIKPYLQQFQVQRVGYVTRLWTRGNEKPPPKKPRNKTARYRAMLKAKRKRLRKFKTP